MSDLEDVEARAYAGLAEAGGGGAIQVRGGVCLHSPVPTLVVNRVLAADATLDLDAVAGIYAGAHLVAVPPWASELDAQLAARGYERDEPWAKLTRDDAPAETVGSDLRVERTYDEGVFGATVAAGFGAPTEAAASFAVLGLPGFAGFLAWANGEPAAGALVFVDGDHAWFGAASTRPAFRGRGAQSSLLAARIEHARSRGATTLTLETAAPAGGPSPSRRNAVRAGFCEAYVRPNWRSPA